MCNNNRLPSCWVISEGIAFDAGTNVLTINLPDRGGAGYAGGCTYTMILGQNLPAATTINATVEISIGDGTVTYPLQRCNGTQVTAAALRTLSKYPIRANTNAVGGAFTVLGGLCCAPVQTVDALTGDAPDAEGGGA